MWSIEKSNPVVAGGILSILGVISLSGCGEGEHVPEERGYIYECGSNLFGPIVDGSNIEPTPLKTTPDYNRATDPAILLQYQRDNPSEFDVVGLGTILCERVDSQRWDGGTETSHQVLTLEAVSIANIIATQAE